MRRVCLTILAGALIWVATAAAARADTIGVDFNHAAPAYGISRNQMRGYEFTLSGAKTLTALGFFDYQSNGLRQSHQVGVWRSDGTLLVSTTVSNASTAVASASSVGTWMFETITPFELGIGSYIVGAHYGSVAEEVVYPSVNNAGSMIYAPGLIHGSNRWVGSTTFTLPTAIFSSGFQKSSLGPGLLFGAAGGDPVPEPSTAALLGLGGVLLWIARRRR